MNKNEHVYFDVFGYPYPLTIVSDRYSGVYSGGDFTAWNLDADEVPEQIYSDDSSCLYFFEHTNIPYGRGGSPNEAIADLVNRLKGD